ncbi:MAG: hypothetical protein GX808_04665 [Syntrophomonadaceae bacterium]|nr:hypothetical protein [Syntrophomonadaceae bacterium]
MPYTRNTITDPEALKAELHKTRERGYAIDNEETVMGLGCVAAPIFASSNQVIAAISISGNADLVLRQRFEECLTDVKLAARTIAYGMGYRD